MAAVRPSTETPQRGGGEQDRREGLRRDRELFARYHRSGSPADRDAIVKRFLPLARHLAAGYAGGSEPFDDLFQVACLGLVKAVDRFDMKRHTAFSSFAVPTILGELKRHFRDKTWAVRVPRDLQDLALAVQRQSERLSLSLGRSPTLGEIAEAVDAAPEAVLEARDALGAHYAGSLEEPWPGRDSDDGALVDTLGDHDGGYGLVEEQALLDALLRCLTHREREIVRLRFEHDLTQSKIAEQVGVSQMQVSRVLRASLARLRDALAESAAPDLPRAA